MDRHLIAYLLIGLLVAGVAALVGFKLYHSRPRTLARRDRRLQKHYERRLADRADR